MADLIKDINSLAIFGGLRKREPLASLCKFLKLADEGTQSQNDLIEAYAEFVNSVYQLRPDADFSGALWDALKTDPAAGARTARAFRTPPGSPPGSADPGS